MKTIFAAAIALAALTGGAAHAENYATVGYSQATNDDLGVDVDLGAIVARVGWKQNDGPLGAEAEASFGVDDWTITGGGATAKISLSSQFAVYGVATLPLSEKLNVFGRLGYGVATIEASGSSTQTGPISGSDDESGLHYGVGATYMFNAMNGVRADYTIQDFDGGDFDVMSLSYVRRF